MVVAAVTTVRAAIESGDAEALQRLLTEDASCANALIRWGEADRNSTHPLHFASDMIFNGVLAKGRELPLVDLLIKAGADLDFQSAPKTDTPLIGAASLGAEDVGLALLRAGARPEITGIFGETAFHWAAMLGEDRLVAALIAGSNLNQPDEKYNSPPLGWAIEGRRHPPKGNQGRQCEMAALLVAAGTDVNLRWLDSDEMHADPAMLAAVTMW
jgi:hypothetical protein